MLKELEARVLRSREIVRRLRQGLPIVKPSGLTSKTTFTKKEKEKEKEKRSPAKTRTKTKTQTKIQTPCPVGKERNPATGRCRKPPCKSNSRYDSKKKACVVRKRPFKARTVKALQ